MQAVGGFRFSSIVFILAAVAGLLLLPAAAQVHGVPASVTSIGFGGNFSTPPGVPASVTSIGPHGFGHTQFFGQPFFNQGFHNNNFGHHHHQGFFGGGYLSYGIPYAYPVAVPVAVTDDYEDDQYNGGPTIFDRRGPGPSNRREEERYRRDDRDDRRDDRDDVPEARSAEPGPQEPVANQPATAVVFKDGHSIELSNYAIIGPTLYDLTPGHPRKILLADIDVPATQKQNDEHGVDFNLPPAQE